MECVFCESKRILSSKEITYRYTQSGLNNVILHGVILLKCDSCLEEYFNFGDVVDLHKTIAKVLIRKKSLLNGKEIRFLRKNMLIALDVFAEKLLCCSEQTLSKIENDETLITKMMDNLIRIIVSSKMDGRNDSIVKVLEQDLLKDINIIELEKTAKDTWKEFGAS